MLIVTTFVSHRQLPGASTMRVSLYESATGELMVRRHGLPLLYRVDPNSGRTFAEDAASIEDHREHELARDALDLSHIPTRDWPRIRLIAQWAAGRIVIESEPAPEMRRYVGI